MPYLDRNGLNLYYELHGKGTPFIFSHGLGSDLSQIRELLEELPGIRLLLYDNRGHGRTRAVTESTQLNFATMADDVAALLDHLGIGTAVVGGISMGAGIALRFGTRYANRASALILSRPAWLNQPNPANLAIFPEIARKVEELGCHGAQEWFEQSQYFRSLEAACPEAAKSLLRLFLDRRPEQLVHPFRCMPASIPFASFDELKSMRIPALVLSNRNDPIHPVSCAEQLAAAIPSARLREFAAKSESLVEHKRQFREHVINFVEALPSV